MNRIEQGWVGIDAGKGHHHVVLIDRDGRQLLSRRVDNDELALTGLIETVRDRSWSQPGRSTLPTEQQRW